MLRVNGTYINAPFTTVTISRMHESLKRLLDAAHEATRNRAIPITELSQLQKDMGESAQTINNWKGERGVSKEGAMKAEQLYGCSVTWVREGIGKPSLRGKAIAQHGSLNSHTVGPQLVRWGDLMGEIPTEFRVAMPDDAMKPDAEAGWEVEFVKADSGSPGQGVLVKDSTGRRYFRKYQEGRGDEWEAKPSNPDYLTLHSKRDGLEVVAVMTFVRRPRLG